MEASTKDLLHLRGSVLETGTTAVTGDFVAITTITATVFAVLTDATRTGDAITTATFPANFTLYGNITAFTLTSGSVIAYNRK